VILPAGVHLGYCTNVHAAETVEALGRVLERVAARVRERLLAPRLGLGLYLPASAAAEVDAGALAAQLDALGLYAFTINGFPYGDFHADRVKEIVYTPSWADPRRAAYTLRLAEVLERIAPADVARPTISTVPLGWRIGWTEVETRRAAQALVGVARALAERGGRRIRICLEPEPGCVIESTADAVRFFGGPLADAARTADDAAAVRAHLGICFDTCHQAVAFEDPGASLTALAAAGIAVGKAQLSSALELADPADDSARARLASFDEPRFLHQARARGGRAEIDLAPALRSLPRSEPWRVHFHVPIDRAVTGALTTTQGELLRAIEVLRQTGATDHFEVETYTWSVLPPGERPLDDEGLAAGLARELAWARARLLAP
jgi:sugar phosphate isomerase/epimerase